MELVCPQCSKQLQVSAEEVALHGGAVVCPQCLTVFDASEHVPAGTVAERPVRVIEEHLTYGYCPHCGRKIPQGVNYCPYCGQELASVGTDDLAAAEATESQPAEAGSAPEAETKHSGGEHSKSSSHGSGSSHSKSHHSSKGRHSSTREWQPVMPSYRYAKMRDGWHSGREKAGPLFTVVAWLVIGALLALLAFIVRKVNMLP